ncbi:MAG: hypothetical protein QM736_09235 [Vicinamibacterales bacterium]
MLKFVRLLTALAAAASLAACSSLSSPSNQTVEDFSGTLDPAAQTFQTFSVRKTGELQVTLQSLTPRPVLGFLTLAIGSESAGTCTPIAGYIIQPAAIGTQYAFPQVVKGSYCVLLSDSNAILKEQVQWTIHLSHP